MKTNSAGSKGISVILMAAGAIMTLAALALDFMGNKASYRGPLLIVGVQKRTAAVDPASLCQNAGGYQHGL